MAYTNFPWVNNIPAGSDPANTADDQLRQLRLDINERQNDIVEDWAGDDPVAVKTREKYIHWQAGVGDDSSALSWASLPGMVGAYVYPGSAPLDLYWRMALPIPAGVTLTELIIMYGRSNAGDIVQFQASKMTTAGALASIAAATSAAIGDPLELSSGALTEVIDPVQYYFMTVRMFAALVGTSAKFYGVRVKYTLNFALQGF